MINEKRKVEKSGCFKQSNGCLLLCLPDTFKLSFECLCSLWGSLLRGIICLTAHRNTPLVQTVNGRCRKLYMEKSLISTRNA